MNQNEFSQNHAYALALEQFIREHRNASGILAFCQYAASWLSWNTSGHWASPGMESVVIEHASKIPDGKPVPEKDRARQLIVMTRSYQFGGHTRIAEALLNRSNSGSFDVYLTDKNFSAPDSLVEATRKTQSKRIQSPHKDAVQTALQLRSLAANYRSIVLLTHPEDITPILAFATPTWCVPIYLYNHADHQFWLGTCIADVVFNMSSQAAQFSRQYRGIAHNELLPIPIQRRARDNSIRNALRKEHGIAESTTVIFSAGLSHKYQPSNHRDFVQAIMSVLEQSTSDVVCIVAGPSPEEPYWQNAKHLSNGRIRAIGLLSHIHYENWFSAADLCVDSIPVSGWTFILDAVAHELPIVFEDNHEFYPDSVLPFATPLGTATTRILKILQSKEKMESPDISAHTDPMWIQQFQDIANRHKTHTPTHITSVPQSSEPDPLSLCLMQNTRATQTRHGRNYLLDLPLPLRIQVIFFLIQQSQWKLAGIVLIFNSWRYSAMKWFVNRTVGRPQ